MRYVSVVVLVVLGWAGVLIAESILHSDGSAIGNRPGKAMEPRIVVDTVRLRDGFATLELREYAQREKGRTAPTSGNLVIAAVTPILADSAATVPSYGYVSREDQIQVKSSSGTDSSLVAVLMVVY